MSHVRRSARAQWLGTVGAGKGDIELASGAARELTFSLEKRKQDGADSTSPEELLAAAHAACFAMSVRATLDAEKGGGQIGDETAIGVDATCVLRIDSTGWSLEEMVLKASIDGFSRQSTERIIAAADARCPVSKALRNSMRITLVAAGD